MFQRFGKAALGIVEMSDLAAASRLLQSHNAKTDDPRFLPLNYCTEHNCMTASAVFSSQDVPST